MHLRVLKFPREALPKIEHRFRPEIAELGLGPDLFVGVEIRHAGRQPCCAYLRAPRQIPPHDLRSVVNLAAVQDDEQRAGAETAKLRDEADGVGHLQDLVVRKQPEYQPGRPATRPEGDSADFGNAVAATLGVVLWHLPATRVALSHHRRQPKARFIEENNRRDALVNVLSRPATPGVSGGRFLRSARQFAAPAAGPTRRIGPSGSPGPALDEIPSRFADGLPQSQTSWPRTRCRSRAPWPPREAVGRACYAPPGPASARAQGADQRQRVPSLDRQQLPAMDPGKACSPRLGGLATASPLLQEGNSPTPSAFPLFRGSLGPHAACFGECPRQFMAKMGAIEARGVASTGTHLTMSPRFRQEPAKAKSPTHENRSSAGARSQFGRRRRKVGHAEQSCMRAKAAHERRNHRASCWSNAPRSK